MPDEQVVAQVVAQLTQLGWLMAADVRQGWVVRLRHAYPVYRVGHEAQLQQVKTYLAQWPWLHLLGRTGAFRYLNSDGVLEDVFRFVGEQMGERVATRPRSDDMIGRWV